MLISNIVLTILAAFWGQVEFRAKQLMPWRNMANGPRPAETSLLLDYISPWNVVALFKSVKNRHHMVFVAILDSPLINLLIVVSTALLSLREAIIENKNIRLIATDLFDGTGLDIQQACLLRNVH